MDKCKIGVNATPFHNRCRGTKCPYFNNEFTLNTKRAAMEKDGNTVYVDDVVTDEVIITDERINHIKERHPNDYERYYSYMKQVVA